MSSTRRARKTKSLDEQPPEPKSRKSKKTQAEQSASSTAPDVTPEESEEKLPAKEDDSKTVFKVGHVASNFSVPDQNGKEISLADLKGHWAVIYFYPKDNTPGCTKEGCTFRDLTDEFASLNAHIYGVSADSPKSHNTFINKYNFKFTLLSDQKRELIKKFKASAGAGRIQRSTALLDPEGVLRATWNPVKGAEKHPNEVLAKLKELQAN
jgi:peroxiredoxin Q/BCP